MMPAAKYREFALAACSPGHQENANLCVKDGLRYCSTFNNPVSRNTDVTYTTAVSPNGVYLKTQGQARPNEYVNVRTYSDEANLLTPMRNDDFKNGGRAENRENAFTRDGNFYLALNGQSNWRDYDGTRTDSYNGGQTYENYPLCTSFNTVQCSQAPVYTGRSVLRREEGDYVNIPCHMNQYACQQQKSAATHNDQPFTEHARSAAGITPLSELDYAIEHCRKVEADQFQPKVNAYLSCAPIDEPQQAILTGEQYHSNELLAAGAPQLSNRFQQQQFERPAHQISSPLRAGGRHRPSRAVVTAITSQIRTLREEMFELKSTTMRFKQHMEKMFEDLATINRMNPRDFAAKSPGDDLAVDRSLEHAKLLSLANFNFEHGRSDSGRPANQFETSADVSMKLSPALLASNSAKMNARDPAKVKPTRAALGAEIMSANQIPAHSSTEREKRPKMTSERPNSDSFAAVIDSDKDFRSSSSDPLSTMSLPHATSSGAQSKLRALGHRSGLRNAKSGSGESVLSRSNAALHTSECSIDSGYQGSSVAMPRERSRELTSQVVTPASPISESPVEGTFAKQEDSVENAHSASVHGELDDVDDDAITDACPTGTNFAGEEAAHDVFYEGGAGSNTDYLTSKHLESFVRARRAKLKAENAVSYTDGVECGEEVPEIAGAVRAKPRGAHSGQKSTSSCSESGDDLLKQERPVPKPRKSAKSAAQVDAAPVEQLAAGDDEVLANSCANRSCEAHSDAQAVSKVELRGGFDNVCTNADTMPISGALNHDCGSDCVTSNVASFENQSASSKQAAVQCITVVKQQQQQQQFAMTPASLGSATAQSRVKLGVSAISAQHREQAKVDDSRPRKANHAKQAMREKFAAVLEHSAAKNRNCAVDDDDTESSVIRRRSMRMMTEFQIYDFQDSSAGLSSILLGDSSASKGSAKQPELPSSNAPCVASKSSAATADKTTPSHPKLISNATTSKVSNAGEPVKTSRVVSNDQKLNRSAISQSMPSEANRNTKMTHGLYHAPLPLPPPPPPPPSSPPPVVARPPSVAESHASVFSEIELVPQKRPTALYGPPLLRPKAALPGVSCDLNASQASGMTGKKISPSAGSAFTPVLSASFHSLSDKPSPITERYDMPFNGDAEAGPVEFKRRASLPIAAVSNKGKYLNEIQHAEAGNHTYSGHHRSSNEGDQRHPLPPRSSLRRPRKTATETLESVISAEEATVTSYRVYAGNQVVGDAKAAPIASNSVDRVAVKTACDVDRRRHVSADRARSSSANRNGSRHRDLENQPVRFNRKDNIKHVVSALRSAGYISSDFVQHQVYDTATSSSAGNVGHQQSKEADGDRIATSQSLARTGKQERSSGRSTSRSRKKDETHHYETVNSLDAARAMSGKPETEDASLSEPFRSAAQEKSGRQGGPPEPTTPTRTHRSTVAMLRASLMGKKTQRSATTDGKRDFTTKVDVKARSASTSSKSGKRVDIFVCENAKPSRKGADTKPKDTSRKSKAESKQRKDKSGSKKSSKPEGGSKKEARQDTRAARDPHLPDSEERRHGNADSEVMERFLAAAAASHNARSPLQKLRSSFRTPRNKTKLLQANPAPRVKDDMDMAPVAGGAGPPFSLGRHAKKLPLREDNFTYV